MPWLELNAMVETSIGMKTTSTVRRSDSAPILEVKDNDPAYDVDKKPPATRGATGGFYSN